MTESRKASVLYLSSDKTSRLAMMGAVRMIAKRECAALSHAHEVVNRVDADKPAFLIIGEGFQSFRRGEGWSAHMADRREIVEAVRHRSPFTQIVLVDSHAYLARELGVTYVSTKAFDPIQKVAEKIRDASGETGSMPQPEPV